jgi:hypothetical protein
LTERHHGERIEKKSVQTSQHEHASQFASFSEPLTKKSMEKEENKVTRVTRSKVMKKIESEKCAWPFIENPSIKL